VTYDALCIKALDEVRHCVRLSDRVPVEALTVSLGRMQRLMLGFMCSGKRMLGFYVPVALSHEGGEHCGGKGHVASGELHACAQGCFSCRVQVIRLSRQVVDQAFPAVAVKQCADAAAAAPN
jgi:hypothetical protein